MHSSWPFYSCYRRGWRSSICRMSSRRLQRRHEEENDKEAQEVPGNSILPRANTFPWTTVCYVTSLRPANGWPFKTPRCHLEHYKVFFFFFLFFFLDLCLSLPLLSFGNAKDKSYENSHIFAYVVLLGQSSSYLNQSYIIERLRINSYFI